MRMSPFSLVAWVSQHMSLNQNDVVLLGTAPGVAPIVSETYLKHIYIAMDVG